MKKKLSMHPRAIISREWRAANPKKNKEFNRKHGKKWRDANPEKVKEYNAKNHPLWRAKNPDKVKILAKKSRKRLVKETQNSYESSLNNLLSITKNRAKRHKRAFNLTLDYLTNLWKLTNGRCKLSGLKMTTGIGTRGAKVSIDRINSRKGYVKGNCQLVRTDVNIAKNALEQKEFIKLCKAIAKIN